jgi:hypothetical protein
VRTLEEHYEIDDELPDKRFWRTVRQLPRTVSHRLGVNTQWPGVDLGVGIGIRAWQPGLAEAELDRVCSITSGREARGIPETARGSGQIVEGRERGACAIRCGRLRAGWPSS